MQTDTPALLRAVYTAYREKRLADVLVHLSDDFRFTLHLPAEALAGAGAAHDKASAARLFEGIIADYDFLRYEPGPIRVTGDTAGVQPRIHYRHKATGKEIETTLVHVWRIRGDKATALDEYVDIPGVASYLAEVAAAD